MTYLLLPIRNNFLAGNEKIFKQKRSPIKRNFGVHIELVKNCHYKAEEEEKEAKIFEENKNPNCFFTFFLL